MYDLIAQGWELMRNLRADEAIGVFQEALERQLSVSDGSERDLYSEARAHEGLASALYFSNKQHEEALVHSRAATELYQSLDEECEPDLRGKVARCIFLGARAAFLSRKFPESFQQFADASFRFFLLADEGDEWAANMLEECLDDMLKHSADLRRWLWSSLSAVHPENERYRELAEYARSMLEEINQKSNE